MTNYETFDVHVSGTRSQGYTARVIASPVGEYSHTFELPFSELALESFIVDMSRNDADGVERAVRAESFGSELFETLFDGEMRGMFRASLNTVAASGSGLRLRLRLAEAPDLADVPWEYLHDRRAGSFLALSTASPVVRYLELPHPPKPISVTAPLRALVVVSSPSGFEALDTEAEWARLLEATTELRSQGRIELVRSETATLEALQGALQQGQYHVFHFIGHGDFERAEGRGALLFETELGEPRAVNSDELAVLMGNHRPLQLAILNACEGARSSSTDPFSGLAQGLIQRGLPAAIAMQFEISDAAAVDFARELYRSMSSGEPIDEAVTSARISLYSGGNATEWATPVLFMRSPTGQLFEVLDDTDPEPAAAADTTEQDERYEREHPGTPPLWSRRVVQMAVVFAAAVAGWVLFAALSGDDGPPTTTTSSSSTTTSAATTTASPSTSSTTASSTSMSSTTTTAAEPEFVVGGSYEMPGLIGLDSIQAAATKLGLACGSDILFPEPAWDPNNPVADGTIIHQIPAAGSVIELLDGYCSPQGFSQTITIFYSDPEYCSAEEDRAGLGWCPKQPQTAQMPTLVGMVNADAAIAALVAACGSEQVTVFSSWDPLSGLPPDAVISQNPPAGTPITRGDPCVPVRDDLGIGISIVVQCKTSDECLLPPP